MDSPRSAQKAPARQVLWEQVKDAAEAEMFCVFMGGAELDWAEYAWGILRESGLTSYSDDLGRARCLIRLMVLGVLFREFCRLAFDEKQEPVLSDWAHALGLDDEALMRLAGGEPPRSEDDEPTEAEMDRLLGELVEGQRLAVRDALLRHEKDTTGMFLSLYAIHLINEARLMESEDAMDDDHEDDLWWDERQRMRAWRWGQRLPDAIARDILNDPTAEKMQAFEWIENGMDSLAWW